MPKISTPESLHNTINSDTNYDDIINLPHHVSKTHPPMSREARAAQFAPYAALTGHRDIIQNNENVANDKIDLDHEFTLELDEDFTDFSDEIDGNFY